MEKRSELLNKERFAWMIGATVESISMDSDGPVTPGGRCYWSINFSGGGFVQVEPGTWRLSSSGGIVVSSDDHGHQFGLPAPIDAVAAAMGAIRAARIKSVFVREGPPDLVVEFDSQLVLDVLATSTGYECWKMTEPSQWVFVVHGSGHASGWQEPLGNDGFH